jgi:hypothetical protein
MGYILVAKGMINYKLYTNSQGMSTNMLIIYIIHVKYLDIIMNFYLWLEVESNFIYATNKFLIVNVRCNLFIVANYNHKLTFFY